MTQLLSAPPIAAPKNEDGGHWYQFKDNTWFPLYKEGGTFTLREARKLKLAGDVVVPSVTTIFKGMHKPQLERWKMEQVAKACYSDGQYADLPEAEYIDAVLGVANNSSRGAMDLGTNIHKAIEQALNVESWDAALDVYVSPTLKDLEARGLLGGTAEQCAGSTKYGYAGKFDYNHGLTICDYKSRKSTKGKVASYSTDKMQLAAGGYALWGNKWFVEGTGIVYGISTNEPGVMTPHVFAGAELIHAMESFLALCTVWRYEHNFDPRVTT